MDEDGGTISALSLAHLHRRSRLNLVPQLIFRLRLFCRAVHRIASTSTSTSALRIHLELRKLNELTILHVLIIANPDHRKRASPRFPEPPNRAGDAHVRAKRQEPSVGRLCNEQTN